MAPLPNSFKLPTIIKNQVGFLVLAGFAVFLTNCFPQTLTNHHQKKIRILI
jgi:hypothetical protein